MVPGLLAAIACPPLAANRLYPFEDVDCSGASSYALSGREGSASLGGGPIGLLLACKYEAVGDVIPSPADGDGVPLGRQPFMKAALRTAELPEPSRAMLGAGGSEDLLPDRSLDVCAGYAAAAAVVVDPFIVLASERPTPNAAAFHARSLASEARGHLELRA